MLQHTPSWISQCLLVCGLGAEGPVQSNHCERRSRQVRLSRVSLCSKRLVSKEIAHVHLNATSDRLSRHTLHRLCGENGNRHSSRSPHRVSTARRSWVLLDTLRSNPSRTHSQIIQAQTE